MIDLDHEGAEEMLDELCEEQLALGVALAAFDGAIVLRPQLPHDGSARAAFATLAERHQDLCAVRDALAQVQISTIDRRFHRLFVADQPLADYLRGVYAWLNAVIRALDHLAHSLRALAPDWALLRWRIEEAKNFHFDELFEPVRAAVAEVSAIPGAAHLAASIESLFAASSALEAHLDERFG